MMCTPHRHGFCMAKWRAVVLIDWDVWFRCLRMLAGVLNMSRRRGGERASRCHSCMSKWRQQSRYMHIPFASLSQMAVQDQELYDQLPEPDDDENDMLDLAYGLTET